MPQRAQLLGSRFILLFCAIFDVGVWCALAGNEYMFYLAATTLAFGTRDAPKSSIVIHSCTECVAAGDAERRKKAIGGAGTNKVPAGRATSSHFKRKHVNLVTHGMFYYCIIMLFLSMPFHY